MTTLEPLIFSDPLAAIAVLAIVFAGAVVQAGLGMGFGLTVAPALALIDPALVPASALYMGTATAAIGAMNERSGIVWREVGIGMAGRFAGIIAGLAVLISITDLSTFSLIFGCIILAAVLISVAGWQLALNTANLLGMGFVSGLMGIVTSVGAPPLALIYQSQDPAAARPTLAAFFMFGGALSLALLYASGLAGLTSFLGALFIAPAAFLGTFMGRRSRGRFDARYRPILLVIAGAASILLILRGIG